MLNNVFVPKIVGSYSVALIHRAPVQCGCGIDLGARIESVAKVNVCLPDVDFVDGASERSDF